MALLLNGMYYRIKSGDSYFVNPKSGDIDFDRYANENDRHSDNLPYKPLKVSVNVEGGFMDKFDDVDECDGRKSIKDNTITLGYKMAKTLEFFADAVDV